MNGRHRWFRQGEWPIWHFDSKSTEWLRLERAAYATGVSILHLSVAAHVLADRADIDLSEAWDRLAFNLERMQDGRWPPLALAASVAVGSSLSRRSSRASTHSLMSQEIAPC